MKLVDSHCHLDDEKFQADRGAVIERAREAGVDWMLAIGTGNGPPDLEAAVRLAEADPRMLATVGVHPHDAAKADDTTIPRLTGLLALPKVVAIGEIGLDYHYDFSPRHRQRAVFEAQLKVAAEQRKPIIIHTREAWPDTFELLERYFRPAVGGIMHCFTGGPEEAERSLQLGFHISFAGIVTYPKATDVQAAAKLVPLDRLLVETDSPYLAPVPHRGKRNEPAMVVATAKRLAELRGEAFETIAEATTRNFATLMNRPEVCGE
ncbi:MAG: TatD family hydrolase [Bryobacterales bacterium]|nr:TatD family hydrolase [Bryobacterales bacterium]